LELKSRDQRFCLAVGEGQLEYILTLCQQALPNETGGVLIGFYDQSFQMAEVVRATEAPADSRSGPTWFHRGVEGLQSMLDGLWKRQRHYYIGEWHFHPFGSPVPSAVDINQLREIANSTRYNCPEPILFIIGGDPQSAWSARAFVFERGKSSYIELFRSGLDEYEHVKVIAEGSFSIVKHYNHKRTGRACAVKELKRELIGNATYVHWFEREIRLLVELAGHENILELLYDQCDHGSRYLYITPKADTNLYDFIVPAR
jgi:integrative and conjugative element protein (TIGR02256 family)